MILVTGAGGLAGTAVLPAVAARRQAAHALVRSPHAAERTRAAGASEVTVGDMTRADDVEAAAARGMGAEQIRRSLQMFDFFTWLGSPHESTHTLSWLIGQPPTDFRTFIERLVAEKSHFGARTAG